MTHFVGLKTNVLVTALALIATGCGAEVDSEQPATTTSGTETDSVQLALDTQTSQIVDTALANPGLARLDYNRVFTLEHFVRISRDRRIFVRESFTLKSWLRRPRRAILMAAALPVTDEFLNMPIDGYRGRELMAKRGFFAYTMDFEGAGQSTYPEDGFSVTYDSQTEVMLEVIDRIRLARGVRQVDLFGEGEAAGVAAQACADARRARSCVLASLFYATGTDFFNAVFNGPEFRALVLNAPQGYLPLGPESYFNILSASGPDVIEWVQATQPGTYSMGLIAEYMRDPPPPFDATQARVPGLVIRGEFDQNTPLSDSQHLASDYGSASGTAPATVVQIPGAKLIPRIEPAPTNQQFWNAVLEFVDP